MNARQYKRALVLTAAPLFLMLGWGGLPSVAALPALPGWVLGTHRADLMTALALMAAAGLIAAYGQSERPCPLPQLRMSCLLGVGYVLMMLWEKEGSLSSLLDRTGPTLLRMAKAVALFFPAVTASSFLFTLLLPRRRRAAIRMASLNLLALALMTVAAEAVRTLLRMPKLEVMQMVNLFPELRRSAYALALQDAMGLFMRIPPGLRALAGGAGLAAVLPRLYREGANDMSRARPRMQRRSPSTPQYRPAGAAAQMNARDLELLDALCAQTAAGHPVGLNTETGTVSLRGHGRTA